VGGWFWLAGSAAGVYASPMRIDLEVRVERWPVAGAFTIARGSRTEAVIVVAELRDGVHVGRGECVPYARYGESAEGVVAAIESMRDALRSGLDRTGLQAAMPPGAARNALDCAFWDIEAKQAGRSASALAGLPAPRPLVTAYTISLGDPNVMGQAASAAASRALLKIKLGGPGDPARLRAVRAAAPDAELIVDANEAWTADTLAENLAACRDAGVTLIEQPLPAGDDAALAQVPRTIPICADESLHDRDSLAGLRGRYDAINIKLDKAGGLTEALALADAAERLGLGLMVGCMLSTSLSMAPAMLVAQRARVVDLDGALLLARDRPHGLRYEGSLVHPAAAELWG
jgi:L-alanine-DL-glutamate epimerase-like enolase superfamily enzyme